MSHVDDGRIHAWLDGALLPDDPARVQLEAHLAECEACRARVEAERRIRERATDVLRTAAPDAVRVEPFEGMVAARRARRAAEEAEAAEGAAEPVPGRVDSVTAEASPRKRRRYMPLAWAASLLMAVSAGWFARALMPANAMPASPRAESDVAAAEALGEPQPALGAVAERSVPPAGAPGVAAGAGSGDSVRRDTAEPGRTATGEREQAVRTGAGVRANQAEGGIRSTEETRRLADAITLDEARAQEAPAAPAPALLVMDAAPLNEAGLAVLADARSAAWEPVTEEGAAVRLGRVVARIEDLPIDSLQAAPHDAGWMVRVFQQLETGERAEVLQWNESVHLEQLVVPGGAERKALGFQAVVTADSAARRVARDSVLGRRERQAEVAAAAAPRPAAEPAVDDRPMARLMSLGFRVLVRADVSAGSLAAIARRIR